MSAALLQSIASNTWSILLIVLFFNGTIFVHEFGHFLTARRRGVKVERFSIGFGPKIFSWHGQDGVEYRLSWLPLGGYVLLPQLADLQMIEGESAAQLQKLPPVSYTTKMLVFLRRRRVQHGLCLFARLRRVGGGAAHQRRIQHHEARPRALDHHSA